jgi:SAM-dependent methyltransferase
MSLDFRSPKHDRAAITIPPEAADLQKSFNGTVCSNQGDEYVIKNNIIDFLGDNTSSLSWAQSSNQWKVTAALYEDIWRKRSLSILTGEEFPIKKEQELLVKWLNPMPGNFYLDIGCSTALYGRLLKKSEPDCEIVSLDLSKQMLQEARLKAKAEGIDMYLLRADASHLPFFSDTFDGLTMGGTLNELADPLQVLFESRRVIKKGGVYFMMHLIKADVWYLRLLQESTGFSGLKFWTMAESNEMFERAGFQIAKQMRRGIVCFTKLKA